MKVKKSGVINISTLLIITFSIASISGVIMRYYSISYLSYLYAFFQYSSIIFLFSFTRRFFKSHNFLIKAFFILSIINIIRTFFNYSFGYEQARLFFLSPYGVSVMFVPLFIVIGYFPEIYFHTQRYILFFFKISAIIGFVILFNIGLFPYFLILSIFYLILLLPFLKSINKIWIIFLSVFVVFHGIQFRSNVLRIISSLIIYLPFIRYLKVKKYIFGLSIVLFIIPLVMLILGTKGYNPFTNLESNNFIVDDKDITVDTRTFLYIDIYNDIINNNCVLFGKGAYAPYYSAGFDIVRTEVEVGVLSDLIKYGVVGVLLKAFILLRAIYLSILRSKSEFMIKIGLMLVVYWIIYFFENLPFYGMIDFVFWMCIGLCYSKRIRDFTDSDFKKMLNRI